MRSLGISGDASQVFDDSWYIFGMNEMIPVPRRDLMEKPDPREEEPIPDGSEYIIAKELAPSQPTLEILSNSLNEALTNAPDYDVASDVLQMAVDEHGHQTVETILLARFTEDPSPDTAFYLDMIGGMAERQTIPSHESYRDPSFEDMTTLQEMVSKYPEEAIRLVADITDSAEAQANPVRLAMSNDIAPLYKLACKLRWESKVTLDTDRSQYPEFWQIFDRFEEMYRAVGIVNSTEGKVRHDLEVKR